MQTYDLIVIGGGAAGTGAALTASRRGLRTLWVERETALGGTGVHALVNVWQPSCGISPLAREIAERLVSEGHGIYTSPTTDTPDGRPLYRRAPNATYSDTLYRWDSDRPGLLAPAFTYEPAPMASTLAAMASEAGVDLALGTVFLHAEVEPSADGLRRVASLELHTPRGSETVRAARFVDATDSIAVARSASCRVSFGREAREEYGEPSAPDQPEFCLNGWTLCFICREGPARVELPTPAGGESSWAHISQMPHGGWNVNLCFQIAGEVGWQMGVEAARELLLGNIARRWPSVRQAYGLEGYGIAQIARRVGVREGPRLRARYVLNEHDHRLGKRGAHHPDCIAFTDHAMDRHSPDGGCLEAHNGAVGVPLRCLQPCELDNLLVAGRGAGFSSLAASAVRLQRTMMELGEAAANAIAEGRV